VGESNINIDFVDSMGQEARASFVVDVSNGIPYAIFERQTVQLPTTSLSSEPIAIPFAITDPDGDSDLTVSFKLVEGSITKERISIKGDGAIRRLEVADGTQSGNAIIDVTVQDTDGASTTTTLYVAIYPDDGLVVESVQGTVRLNTDYSDWSVHDTEHVRRSIASAVSLAPCQVRILSIKEESVTIAYEIVMTEEDTVRGEAISTSLQALSNQQLTSLLGYIVSRSIVQAPEVMHTKPVSKVLQLDLGSGSVVVPKGGSLFSTLSWSLLGIILVGALLLAFTSQDATKEAGVLIIPVGV